VRYLIVSDIHANWEALEAVLDASAGRYDQVVCCGDLIGYGPDPNAVVDWTRAHVLRVIRGNHDRGSVGMDDLEWFNPVARAAALWTQQELTPVNADYVRALPRGPMAIGNWQISHGSPLDEDGYIVSATDAAFVFPYVASDLTFFGHSHLQGGFTWSRLVARSLGRPKVQRDPLAVRLEENTAYLINPGSVGQPRDQDTRAAYVLYDEDACCLYFARVTYDVDKVQAKIRRAGLPEGLANRLGLGR